MQEWRRAGNQHASAKGTFLLVWQIVRLTGKNRDIVLGTGK
jgi:hypothetical protein